MYCVIFCGYFCNPRLFQFCLFVFLGSHLVYPGLTAALCSGITAALCSGITPSNIQELYGVCGMETGLAVCKASTIALAPPFSLKRTIYHGSRKFPLNCSFPLIFDCVSFYLLHLVYYLLYYIGLFQRQAVWSIKETAPGNPLRCSSCQKIICQGWSGGTE